MKNIFIGANSKREPDYLKIVKEINKISAKRIAICYSNQFMKIATKIADKIDKEVLLKIQVLGCSNPKFPEKVEAILMVGQGKFHTISIAYESKLPTYVLEGNHLWKVSSEDVAKLEKRDKGMYLKYLTSQKIGIIVTNKPGQQRLKKALDFKNNLTDKQGYLFISNNVDINEFENFGMDTWINTACPRMDLTNASLINLDKLEKLQEKN